MALAIIVDSASNIDKEMMEKYHLDIVSLTYEMDGVVYPCFNVNKSYEEQGKEFYDALRSGKQIKTSLASPNVYYETFKKHLDLGEDILSISISSKLSGSLNSSLNAKAMLEEEYPKSKIVCLDSLSASFGEAIIALEAAKLRDENASLDTIVEKISAMRLNVHNEFTVDDLTYLKTGGRIQSFIYQIVNLLDIKPMLRASKEATIELCGKVRGRKKSLLKLVETVKETILNPENQTLYIAHCDIIEDAKKVANMLKEEIPTLKDIFISMYDFCTGAHVGPGTIALFYIGKPRS